MKKGKTKIGSSADLPRLAENALSESEERFRFLSEATFEGIVVHEEGRVIKANNQFFHMFGYEPRELVGKQVVPVIIAPESVEVVKEQIRSKSGKPYEAMGMRKDGTMFPIEIHAKPMTYKGREVRVAAIRDVSERRRAEEALRESARLNQLLLDTLPHPAMLIGRDRIVKAANRTVREGGGLKLETIVGAVLARSSTFPMTTNSASRSIGERKCQTASSAPFAWLMRLLKQTKRSTTRNWKHSDSCGIRGGFQSMTMCIFITP